MANDKENPANGAPRLTDKTRVPMSSGQAKLKVADIPGFYLYWMRGTPERIQEALAAGYTFVSTQEVSGLRNLDLAGDAKKSGNTDLGTRVSVLAGSEMGEDGQPLRLYLMKLPYEWHEQDEAARQDRNGQIQRSLREGSLGASKESGADARARYVKSTNTF